jgi:transposase
MQGHEWFVGVDVGKSRLSVCVHGVAGCQDLDNDQASIGLWLSSLPGPAVVAVESTGRYHLGVIELAHAQGHRVYVLNARDVYFYAKALGARGKTDRNDARIIARYLAEHHEQLQPYAPGTPTQQRLQQLLRCRVGISTKRMSLRQVLRDVPDLGEPVVALEHKFDELLACIDSEVQTLVGQDVQLSQGQAALRTITGIGPQGAAMLTALLSRVKFANADALVAYSGLDPRPNDSGAKTGRRRISKRGDPQLRRQLYLSAFAASHSKALGPMYKAIKAKGFKPTQALVILARKLLRVAWAVWRSGQPFDPSRLAGPGACAKT